MPKDNKYYPLLDVVKLLMSILVILAHSRLLCGNNLFSHIFSFVLPIFFACSGYLYYGEQVFTFSTSLKKIKRVIILYLIWLVPNFPTVIKKFSCLSLSGILQTSLFSGTYMVSWYLNALIWCMFIVAIIACAPKKYYYWISSPLALLSYCIANGFVILPEPLRNLFWLPYSFIPNFQYFFIGALLKDVKLNRWLSLSLVPISVGVYLAMGEISCMKAIIVLSIMSLMIYGIAPASEDSFRYVRNMSTIFYLGHPMILIGLKHLLGGMSFSVLILTVILLLGLSMFLFRLEKKWQYIKYFY